MLQSLERLDGVWSPFRNEEESSDPRNTSALFGTHLQDKCILIFLPKAEHGFLLSMFDAKKGVSDRHGENRMR